MKAITIHDLLSLVASGCTLLSSLVLQSHHIPKGVADRPAVSLSLAQLPCIGLVLASEVDNVFEIMSAAFQVKASPVCKLQKSHAFHVCGREVEAEATLLQHKSTPDGNIGEYPSLAWAAVVQNCCQRQVSQGQPRFTS